MSEIEVVKERHEEELLKIPGVVGVGISNERAIIVYVESEEVVPHIPKTLEGYPVEVIVTGRIETFP